MNPDRLSPIVGYDSLRRIMVAALGPIILGVLGLGMLGMSAEAGDAHKRKEPTRSVYLFKYHVGGEVRYAKRPAGKVVRVSAARYRNGNAYVCTPSGFGQKARCYVRAN